MAWRRGSPCRGMTGEGQRAEGGDQACHVSSFRGHEKKAESKEMPTGIKTVLSPSQRAGAPWRGTEGLREKEP